MPKRPIGGKNAKGGGWSAPNMAMGTGVVHIPRVATLLAEIGFNGPSELQSEYAGIGGAETGADKITRPRQFVIGMLKRDVITIRKSFEMANAAWRSRLENECARARWRRLMNTVFGLSGAAIAGVRPGASTRRPPPIGRRSPAISAA